MKSLLPLALIFIIVLASCNGTKKTITTKPTETSSVNDTIRIANDELEYEVIIIDPGFSTWLASRSFPRNYHSLNYLENKNQLWISEWNNRVLQPYRYDPNLYEMTISYSQNIEYGYEVNYLIYNYMVYFQNTFKQKLFGYVPSR